MSITPAPVLFRDIYGKDADTSSGEFRVFCLALYIQSKARNRDADDDHKELLKKKYPRVLPVIEHIKEHARKQHKEQMGRARGLL